jgi:predicted ABC-type ATPase
VNPPEALILAGPNGAGKTTSSAALVPEGTRFLNSDVITARLLREGHPVSGVEIAAGRLVLEQLRAVVATGEPFCIETNLAGRGFLRWIDDWRAVGYEVRLVFTALTVPNWHCAA